MPGVYLDHCATTPLDPAAASAMEAARDQLAGNPSSVHTPGRRARAVLNEARSRIARVLAVSPAELVFTASGSEANNLAIKGVAFKAWPSPFHLVVSAIEHDCIRTAARYLAGRFEHIHLIEVKPDGRGIIEPEAVEAALPREGRTLLCVMAVNNETGTIQPVVELAQLARRRDALFLCDAVQALGRLNVAPESWGCDFLSASAHKIRGPKGVGLLYVRRGTPMDPLVHGGHQEAGRRAGTENGEGIVGFAEALGLAAERREENETRLRRLESRFMETLRERGAEFALNGGDAPRVDGVLNLAFPGLASHDLVVGMDLAGFAISAGSACSSGVIEPSHVLRAMGLEPWRIEGGIRISFGASNTLEEARSAAEALAALALRLRSEAAAISSP